MNRFAKFWYKERPVGTYMILFAGVISVAITVFAVILRVRYEHLPVDVKVSMLRYHEYMDSIPTQELVARDE